MRGPICAPASNPGATRKAFTRSTNIGMNRSAMPDWTYTRLAQMQDCPATRKNLMDTAPSAAAARSASSNTMNGAFPPSSKETRFSCWLAPAIRLLPTSVDPVKATLRTAG